LKWTIWLGKDKYENDELIKWGWPNDVWCVEIFPPFDPSLTAVLRFHVDDLPSAHAYIRLPEDVTIDTIPEDVMEDCCQLVKNNSIQGALLDTPIHEYLIVTNTINNRLQITECDRGVYHVEQFEEDPRNGCRPSFLP